MNTRHIGIALIAIVVMSGIVVLAIHFLGTTEKPADRALSPTPRGNEHIDREHATRAQELINGGLEYLLAHQKEGGGWESPEDTEGPFRPGITAMVLKAVVQHPDFDRDSEVVRQAVAALMEYRREDGGFYDQGLQNYCTSLAVMALAALDDPAHEPVIRDAVKFLNGIQIMPGEKTPEGQTIDEDHPFVGGTSYGKHGRPDLSNLGFTIEAWNAAGVPADDENVQRALAFVTRTQNLSETNSRPWAALPAGNDGGFIYAPAVKGDLSVGESKADPDDPRDIRDRGHRSYGSMTYTGFKSLLYAGLSRDDKRVRAAYDWIRRYWRLDSNPNMPGKRSQQGLYYYYHAFAKALRAWEEPVIEDTAGREHNWRHELVDALAQRVQPDGSWINTEEERWAEGNPVLATAYSVLALQEAMK